MRSPVLVSCWVSTQRITHSRRIVVAQAKANGHQHTPPLPPPRALLSSEIQTPGTAWGYRGTSMFRATAWLGVLWPLRQGGVGVLGAVPQERLGGSCVEGTGEQEALSAVAVLFSEQGELLLLLDALGERLYREGLAELYVAGGGVSGSRYDGFSSGGAESAGDTERRRVECLCDRKQRFGLHELAAGSR